MHFSRIPLGPNRAIETSLILRHRGIRIRQVLDEELRRLAILLLGDDDFGVAEIFAVGGFDPGRLNQEFGVGSAFAQAFTAP
jgi:hypothetical protein